MEYLSGERKTHFNYKFIRIALDIISATLGCLVVCV